MLVIPAGLGPYCAIQCSENGVLLTRKLCSGRTRSAKKSSKGAVAQLVERLLCKQDVVGSTPSGSTNLT